jgi:hypothetical protein
MILFFLSNKIIPVPKAIAEVNANIFFNKMNNIIIFE